MSDEVKTLRYARKLLFPRSLIIFCGLSLVQIALIFFIIRTFALSTIENELMDFTQRVSQGLSYVNGTWDTTRYTADPETPHPSGSSGFSTPLYIIGTDGFVIERNSPINGLLDSSDFNHLMEFREAQTIKVLPNEQWRILSRPIMHNGRTIGVIVVALYHPERFVPTISDAKLTNTISFLATGIKVSEGVIDVSNIDIRGVDYDISFEIVNNFNKALLNNGRMPTFIDKSYVYEELELGKRVRIIEDPIKKISYMIVSKTLFDEENNPVGIVLAGKPINFIQSIFVQATPFFVATVILFTLLSFFCLKNLIIDSIYKIIRFHDEIMKVKPLPKSIYFDRERGKLSIDNNVIEIPLDSNQYYFCKTIFSNIKKRWEFDEILEAFGDDANSENWRKVYDTMNILNKKLSQYIPIKFIELREKTYFINPELHSVVRTS